MTLLPVRSWPAPASAKRYLMCHEAVYLGGSSCLGYRKLESNGCKGFGTETKCMGNFVVLNITLTYNSAECSPCDGLNHSAVDAGPRTRRHTWSISVNLPRVHALERPESLSGRVRDILVPAVLDDQELVSAHPGKHSVLHGRRFVQLGDSGVFYSSAWTALCSAGSVLQFCMDGVVFSWVIQECSTVLHGRRCVQLGDSGVFYSSAWTALCSAGIVLQFCMDGVVFSWVIQECSTVLHGRRCVQLGDSGLFYSSAWTALCSAG
ncbi:hypothetical protein RRG08_050588 [Elysia crispata]|uniref:Uncharacterized protein n=1 Tax=Elysia crispata TaxID=231223 RepID=A0AAE0Z6Z9_9GAST|nr:hypothetical protein RRG08_050588 [Elysia crispata]